MTARLVEGEAAGKGGSRLVAVSVVLGVSEVCLIVGRCGAD